jgi:hypothetical protein
MLEDDPETAVGATTLPCVEDGTQARTVVVVTIKKNGKKEETLVLP